MSGDDVSPALRAELRARGLHTVEGAFAFAAGDDLEKAGLAHRRRTRLELADADGRTHVLYLKRYAKAVGPALRRLWTYGRVRSAARTEFDNIRAARAVGVATMREVVCGQTPCPIGAQRSYLIVSAVPGEALERCFEGFLARHAADGQVSAVTDALGELVRTLHQAGYVHRDLYASHVFLDDSSGRAELYLIDLGRMFSPRWRKRRWYVKDVAQLKYSMPAAWVGRYWRRFLTGYLAGVSPRVVVRFDRAVDRKVARMRRRGACRRAARLSEAAGA